MSHCIWFFAAANCNELIPGMTSIFSLLNPFLSAILSTVFNTPENPGSPVDNIDTFDPLIASSTASSNFSTRSFTLNEIFS